MLLGSDAWQKEIELRLFSLRSRRDLECFVADMECSNAFSASLVFLVRSWLAEIPEDSVDDFNPREFLSDDLSAAILGKFPIVFMGTNAWATKPYLDCAVHQAKIEQFLTHLRAVLPIFAGKKVALVIIPEKDYVIDKHFLHTGRFAAIDAAFSCLKERCGDLGVSLAFNEYLEPLAPYEKPEDFHYLDTHLPWRHYIQLYAHLLTLFRIEWQQIAQQFSTQDKQVFSDLHGKFTGHEPKASWARVPYVSNADLRIVGGAESFAIPLGNTMQLIVNQNPLHLGKVLLLGDSHSSILSKNNLTYLFASTFECCEFHWNPCGVREIPKSTDADMVVMEISQRFLI